MFGLSGVGCVECGKALEHQDYRKDEYGEGIYWANPKICQYTNVIVNFCGPACSTAWFLRQIEASKDVTQST